MILSIEKPVRLEALLVIPHEIPHEILLENLLEIQPEVPLFSAQSAHNHESS